MSDPSADSFPKDRNDGPPAGFLEIRRALVGLGLLWLTAISAVGAILAAVYGLTASAEYLLVSVLAAALAVRAGIATVRTFRSDS